MRGTPTQSLSRSAKGLCHWPLPDSLGWSLVAIGRAFRESAEAGSSSDPIATTEAYVHESLRGAAAKIELGGETIFRQLERLAGVKILTVTQDIQAVSAPADVAKALGIPKRAPCLRIIRSYRDANEKILEIASSHHPGDCFAYSMHIEVEG